MRTPGGTVALDGKRRCKAAWASTVPQVLTLKARPGLVVTDLKNGRSECLPAHSVPFLVRVVYFILFGWWFSLLWATLAWLLCATIIGLPLGVMMLNGLPAVTTLANR